MRIRIIAIVVAVTALLAAAAVYVILDRLGSDLSRRLRPEACTVHSGNDEFTLDPPQMANAATIAAVGIRRGLPTRAVTVALATALQESKLENLSGGDRDSVGLFQQRPSQGWGSSEQISDPRYASGEFYAALVKVPGWQSMPVTAAAQAVQRSAHPDAYDKWTDEAELLSKVLHGDEDAAVACTFRGTPDQRGRTAVDTLAQDLRLDWGESAQTTTRGSTGVALVVTDEQAGWRFAHWLVSHSRDNGVKRVRFQDRAWTATEGRWSKVSAEDATKARSFENVTADVWS